MSLKILLVAVSLGILSLSSRGQEAHRYYHHDHHPQPYQIDYNINDYGGGHYRREHGDGHGRVKGSYGFIDQNGIYRDVHYVADQHGFRAEVKTNDPHTVYQEPADVRLRSDALRYLNYGLRYRFY